MSLVQKSNCFLLTFFTEIISEKSVLILWKEKNDFKREKLKFLKGPKNGHFPKGLVHGFCQKSNCLLWAFLTEIISEKIVCDIVERKE